MDSFCQPTFLSGGVFAGELVALGFFAEADLGAQCVVGADLLEDVHGGLDTFFLVGYLLELGLFGGVVGVA